MRREIKTKDFSLEKASKIPELKFLASPAFKDAFGAAFTKYWAEGQVGEEGVRTSYHQPDSIFIERDGKTYEVMFPEIELSWSRRSDDGNPEECDHDEESFYRDTVVVERTQDYLKKNKIGFAEGLERESGRGYSGAPTLADLDKLPDVKVKIPWDETAEYYKLNYGREFGAVSKMNRLELHPIGLLGQSGRQGAEVKYFDEDGKVTTGYATYLENAQASVEKGNKKIQDFKDFKRKYAVE